MNLTQHIFRLLNFWKELFPKKINRDRIKIQNEAEGESDKHNAFICYSRKNEAFASRLEDFAESYKPPKDLPVPQRYLDLFRDKRDFTAGDYYQNRDKHLKNSDKLIVICSPEARKSNYVNDEIKQFSEFNGSINIIPILFSGIPNNEILSGQEDQMSFPEALCQVMQMPLAVNYWGFDVTKDKLNKGTFTDSWYSLLGAIYNRSRAEVEQREKRKRIRIRRITYSILGGSILILCALLTWVWISRNEAFDRKLAAEAASFDALASQKFAESRSADMERETELERLFQLKEDYEAVEAKNPGGNKLLSIRLSNLNQEISQTEMKLKMLEEQSKALRLKGKQFLVEADEKWNSIEDKRESWVAARNRPSITSVFSLELLNASSQGKCMILHFGDIDDPKFIIIGGDLPPNYKEMLKPRLQQIKDKWSPAKPLPLEIVIASEMDYQSIGGLIAMTDSLLKEKDLNVPGTLNIGTIWYNCFEPQPDKYSKARLPLNAKSLNIPLNKPFDHFVMRPDSTGVSINIGSLKITVINPDFKRLEELAKLWNNQVQRIVDSTLEVKIPEENFTSPVLKLNKAPLTALDNPILKGPSDKSSVNLASICLVFEFNNKRILFTGDAVGRDLIKGLYAAGYLSENGTTHMDVLILPHSASDRNVSKDFLERITADNYIFFGDGTFNNPDITTLKMVEDARAKDTITMFFVNRDGINNHGNKLDQYFLENQESSKQHRRVFRRFNKQNLIVNLLEPIRY